MAASTSDQPRSSKDDSLRWLVGTTISIVALAISVVALSYTMWSDRSQRKCDFLYRHLDRIVALDEALETDSLTLQHNLRKIRARRPESEHGKTNPYQLVAEIPEQLGAYMQSARRIYKGFYRYQYIFARSELTRATKVYHALVKGADVFSAGKTVSSRLRHNSGDEFVHRRSEKVSERWAWTVASRPTNRRCRPRRRTEALNSCMRWARVFEICENISEGPPITI